MACAYMDSFWNLPGEHNTHADERPVRRRYVPTSQQSALAPFDPPKVDESIALSIAIFQAGEQRIWSYLLAP